MHCLSLLNASSPWLVTDHWLVMVRRMMIIRSGIWSNNLDFRNLIPNLESHFESWKALSYQSKLIIACRKLQIHWFRRQEEQGLISPPKDRRLHQAPLARGTTYNAKSQTPNQLTITWGSAWLNSFEHNAHWIFYFNSRDKVWIMHYL